MLTDYGKKVKIKMIEKGLTLDDLAKEIGVSKQYISKVLNNESCDIAYIIGAIDSKLGTNYDGHGTDLYVYKEIKKIERAVGFSIRYNFVK